MQNLTLKVIIHFLMNGKVNKKKATDKFPWAIRFTNIDVKEKVTLLHKTVKNIIRSFIPDGVITCNDRDPPWINKNIKELLFMTKTKLRSHIVQSNTTHFLFISSKFFNKS